MKKIATVLLGLVVTVCAQAPLTWQWTGRTHGELDWTTIETEHYRIHHHQGIEEIAREGASIAEQVRPVLLQQMTPGGHPCN